MRVRKRLLAHALALHKYQRLQQQVVLSSLTLDVVHHISELYVGVKTENRHKKSKKAPKISPSGRQFLTPASRHLKITNSVQSQGLDTVANGNYIRVFGRLRCSFCTGPSCRRTVTSLIIFRCSFR